MATAEPVDPGPVDVTQDMNELVAKAMRAKLMRNTKLHAELQAKIEALRELKEEAGEGTVQPKAPQNRQEGEVVTLSRVDSQGRLMMGAVDRGPDPSGKTEHSFLKEKRPKNVQRFAEGEKTKWFADDDKASLDDLVAQAKRKESSMDENFADYVIKAGAKYKGPTDADDEYDHDVGIDKYDNRKSRMSRAKREEREKEQAIRETKRMNTIQDRCQHCLHGPGMANKQHMVIAMGTRVYLTLPMKESIAQGHCHIVPIEHEVSSRNADDDVWSEIRNFKKCLIMMFAAQGRDVIFLESAIKLKQQHHAIVEAIPLPGGKAAQAPAYYKVALESTSAEEEFEAVHKSIIDTRQKGLRGSIPKNFPYFHVEFGIKGGYAHVIENEEEWDPLFGHKIAAGLMKKEHAGRIGESRSQVQERAEEFKKMYLPHDWTKMLGE